LPTEKELQMKRQRKFAIAGVAGAMLVGAGTGVVLNLPSSAGASNVVVQSATITTDPPAGTSGTTDTTTPPAAGSSTPPTGTQRRGPAVFVKSELDKLVTAGTITQAQEDAILAGIQTNRPIPPTGTATAPNGDGPAGMGGGEGGRGHGGFGGGRSADLTAAATALGVTNDALKTELQAGKTIADVAKEKSVDVQKVITALVAAETANITQRVTDEVNGVKPTRPADPTTATTTPAADPGVTPTTTG
jgi:hypothetical protein